MNLDISISASALATALSLAFKYANIDSFYFLMKNFITDNLFKKVDLSWIPSQE